MDEPRGSWRLLNTVPGDPFRNMAIDETLALAVQRREAPPTLRFYRWSVPSVSIGYFQRLAEAVNLPRCAADGVPVVRRLTGGRAVFHHDEITYSIAAPIQGRAFRTIQETYFILSRGIAAGLKALGIPADISASNASARPNSPHCFGQVSRHEIVVSGRKLVGSAQRRWREAFLQHGSIPLSLDPGALAYILGNLPESGVTALGQFLAKDIGPGAIEAAIITGLEEVLGVHLAAGSLSNQEESLADQLEEKYRQWTGRI